MAYTDITTRAGKGSRLSENVSTKKYREGWDRIFGKQRSEKTKPLPPIEHVVTCMECEGHGEVPQGKLKVMCRVCNGEGLLMYANQD